MGATWKTKWGLRRVRRDNPTIEEALVAAESIADGPGATRSNCGVFDGIAG